MAAAAWLTASAIAPAPSPLDAEEGPFQGQVILTSDVVAGRFGPWALGEISAGSVLVAFPAPMDAGRGDLVTVVGGLETEPGKASGRVYGAVLTVRKVVAVEKSGFLPHRAGRLIRTRVVEELQPFDDARALLAGFLIGETSRIAESDVDAMRRSGLAHFVAVSGSNVALFLGLLAVVAGPLALGPRRRALLGLLGLPVYAAATRFEPSVMRASVMAAIALGGRIVGVVLEAWQLLAVGVALLVLVDPVLTSNVGFQLSVAATGGVLVGARWPLRGRVFRALAVTMGAQIAVAPLLLVHFGSVPLLSPLINLIAAPIVTVSTLLGSLGVAGVEFLIGPSAWLAGIVLALARGAATWPQLSAWALTGLVIGLVALIRLLRPIRVIAVCVGASLLVIVVLAPGPRLPVSGAVVLDVGQGDAILLHGGGGEFALIDGGPDQAALLDGLNRYGVRSLQLMVLTHAHADHLTGLLAAVDQIAVGEAWVDVEPQWTPSSLAFIRALESRHIPYRAPPPGTRFRLGSLELEVEGPVRRYASPNDQSIVVVVHGPTRTMLLPGDIETHAQEDLGQLRADVLKVPHHGAATSDPTWLRSVGAETSIVSVGPNEFGHPVAWVMDLLADTGQVLRTDEAGNIMVDLARVDEASTVQTISTVESSTRVGS